MADLQIQGLRKGFGAHTVLAGVDLAVTSGQLVCVLGPSGSGKTTLLRLICGFERADAGSIAIGGALVEGGRVHLASAARHIGYVAQEGALFPHLPVADNIVFGLPRRLRRAHHRVGELLELVGLPEHFARRWPQELSGGEQQRVALARALAPEPKLILLDEPFSALDAGLRAETRQAVGQALRRSGATALIVTHDQSEALSMGDAVAVLRDGRLAQMADPVTLYRRPRDPVLARFVGEAVLLPGSAANGFVDCPLGHLPLAAGAPEGRVEVLVRPEQIVLHPAGAPGIAAHVRAVTFYGHDASVRLTLDGDGGGEILARVGGHADPRPGTSVSLTVAGPVMTYSAGQSLVIGKRPSDVVTEIRAAEYGAEPE